MIQPLTFEKPALTGTPEFRELTKEEILSLEPDFKAAGAELPDLTTATAFGAIIDGRIVGYIFAQLKLHMEPTKIEDGRSGLFAPLMRTAEEILYKRCGPIWTYVFVKPGRMAALAESRGMEVEPWVVCSKRIGPRAAAVVQAIPVEEPLEDMDTDGMVQ